MDCSAFEVEPKIFPCVLNPFHLHNLREVSMFQTNFPYLKLNSPRKFMWTVGLALALIQKILRDYKASKWEIIRCNGFIHPSILIAFELANLPRNIWSKFWFVRLDFWVSKPVWPRGGLHHNLGSGGIFWRFSARHWLNPFQSKPSHLELKIPPSARWIL